MVCLSLELVGPWIVLGFSEGMEAFDEFLSIMFPGVRSAMAQEQPRGATPRPRSGAMAKRIYLVSQARDSGREEAPCVQGRGSNQGQGQWPGGATPHLRPRAAAGRSNPTSKEW